MSGINLVSPTTFTTACLIGDTGQLAGSSIDSAPSMTKVGANVVSAALELQSTKGAFLLPRMTSAQISAIATPTAGMQVYNTTIGAVQSYANGGWGNPVGTNSITFSLNPTQIANLFTTPLVILSAPGAGRAYFIINYTINMTYNSSPYTGGGQIAFTYGNNPGITSPSVICSNLVAATVFTSSSNTFASANTASNSNVSVTSVQPYVNTAVYLSNTTAAFTGGNSSAVVTANYAIITGLV